MHALRRKLGDPLAFVRRPLMKHCFETGEKNNDSRQMHLRGDSAVAMAVYRQCAV